MKLENLSQGRLNTTMMGVVKAVLDFYHIDSSEAWAFGGSGHAFLINIHEQICPSGPYCWKYDVVQKLLRNLGLEMTDLGFFHQGSAPEERAAVEQFATFEGFYDEDTKKVDVIGDPGGSTGATSGPAISSRIGTSPSWWKRNPTCWS